MDATATDRADEPRRRAGPLTPLTILALIFLGLLLVFALSLTLAALFGARIPFLCSV